MSWHLGDCPSKLELFRLFLIDLPEPWWCCFGLRGPVARAYCSLFAYNFFSGCVLLTFLRAFETSGKTFRREAFYEHLKACEGFGLKTSRCYWFLVLPVTSYFDTWPFGSSPCRIPGTPRGSLPWALSEAPLRIELPPEETDYESIEAASGDTVTPNCRALLRSAMFAKYNFDWILYKIFEL